MTHLKDRLDALADSAVADRELDDPSAADVSSLVRRRRPWLGVAAAVLILLATTTVLVIGRDDGEVPVTAGPPTSDDRSTPLPADAPVLAIAFVDAASLVGPPLVLEVSVSGSPPGGSPYLLPARSTDEVEASAGDGGVTVDRGLIVELPGPGEVEVLVRGESGEVTCPVEVPPGARLIVPVLTRDGLACGAVETVAAWAGDSGEVGRTYAGMAEAEAEAAIAADGYTARVTGRDGLSFLVNADLQPDRVDLRVFDGVVVSAALGDEPAAAPGEPGTAEPLAVVLRSYEGVIVGSGEVTVRVADEAESRTWEAGPEPDLDAGVGIALLFRELPAGPAVLELQGQMCTFAFDLSDGGSVVTLTVASDGTVDQRDCPATADTLDDHVAAATEEWDRFGYERPDGYVGLTEAEAREQAEADGYEVRVLLRDGVPFGRDDDLRTGRLNLVLYDDEVRAAALF